MSIWTNITNVGDITIMAAAATAITAGLVAERAWRIALCWCLLFTLATMLVLATKVAFVGWGIGISALDFTGISGHSMRATAIIPVLCYLILQKKSAATRLSGVLIGIVLGVIIALSRLVLHFHSMSEAIAGCLLGVMVSLSFIYMLRTSHAFELRRPLLAFCLIALLVAPHTEAAPTQNWIVDFALYLSGHQSPFVVGGRGFCGPG